MCGVSIVPVPLGVEHVQRSVNSACCATFNRPVPLGVEHVLRSVNSSCSIRGRTCATECQ